MTSFQTTRWSMVLEARKGPEQARRALETLCRNYRPPVLAYIRGHKYDSDAAEDLTQAFFERFIENSYHLSADPQRGRFRALLLTALKHFLLDADDKRHAVKRGGRAQVRSLDASSSDDSLNRVADKQTPERAFQRAWVHAVIQNALRKLRNEAKTAGKGELFDELSEFLAERPDDADYTRVAEKLGLRRNTVAVAVHRLRNRLRELVREQLADTASDDAELLQEMRELSHSLDRMM
jgi:RNA polymerase sigma factor (sigma-70 family)